MGWITAVPNLFGARDQFKGRHVFPQTGVGAWGGFETSLSVGDVMLSNLFMVSESGEGLHRGSPCIVLALGPSGLGCPQDPPVSLPGPRLRIILMRGRGKIGNWFLV